MAFYLTLLLAPFLLCVCLLHCILATRNRRRALIFFSVSMVVYLGTYVALSVNGGSRWTMSGQFRIAGGFAWSDQLEWFPYGMSYHHHPLPSGEITLSGHGVANIAFAWLTELDRLAWHPTESPFSGSDPLPGPQPPSLTGNETP